MKSEIHNSVSPGPMKVGSLALGATAMALVWLAWYAVVVGQRIEEAKDRHLRVVKLHGAIVNSSEILTMSARMAVTTGDSQWQTRYREFEPGLAKTIQEAVSLAPHVGAAEVVARASVANMAMVQMEHKAFELAGQAHREEAKALLFSDEYDHQKQVYAASMDELDTLIQQAVKQAADDETQRAKIAVVVAAIALPLLLAFWLVTLRTTKGWSSALSLSHETLLRQSTELAQLNEGLDATVAEQTYELKVSRREALRLLDESRRRSTELAQQAEVLRQTTDQLRESEERFHGAFEASAVGIALVAPDGRWLEINRALCEIVGYTDSELLATNFQAITHPDDLTADLEQVRRLLAGELPNYQLEKRYLHKSGRVVPIHLSVSLVRDASGQPLHFVAMIQDITARKEAEQERNLFFGHSLTPMCVFGYDGYIKSLNSAVESTFGHTREELLSKQFLDLIHPDDRERSADEVRRIIAGATSREFELRGLCKDGSYKWIAWDTVPNEEQKAFYAIGHDVTDRHRTEEALAESERFARSTLDALSAHIAILDESGIILATNRVWREFALTNSANTDVGVGANYLDVCDQATGPCGEEAVAVAVGIRSVIRGEQEDFDLEYPCHSPSEKRWFMARATRFGGDGPVRVVMSHENITAAKLADE
ncbi:MAG: PAS domain S-box protein, partial [Planctomycetaceae bacterium]|nr:PAS domain S-box protein [Planctomycetaceae bacterium]